MQSSARSSNLRELQRMISKFPLAMCCNLVTSELGLPWRGVSAAVRKARLPMTPSSVASVLTKYAAKSLTGEELQDVLTRLRLQYVVFHPRTWYVLELKDKARDEPINLLVASLSARIQAALSHGAGGNNRQYQVHTMKQQDLVFISVQQVTNGHLGSILYVASPPGQPVALVSSVNSNMMRACVDGLGYKHFADACIKGKDIPSLLRIHSGAEVRSLTDMPDYQPAPRVCRGGVDYTNSQATRDYVSQILGPDPPVLDSLTVQMTNDFHLPDVLINEMKVTLSIKSENCLNMLQKWAELRAIPPTSELFSVCHTVRSNQIQMAPEDVE